MAMLLAPDLPDDALARRAALGDRTAFAEIVGRHGPHLFRYATTMLDGDVHDAEDAVQSAFTQAWQHLPTFRGDASLKTWLYRITANEVLASRRRRRPIPVDDQLLTPLPAPAGDSPVSRLDGQELRRDLSAALGELPWRQRASWVLAEMEGMTYAQIAAALGTNETVVRGQLHRARRTLAVRMAQWR
ncbi:RNA polymerase sigma factor [Lapillicoccus sp.]|uniref:RNA polymerase sigma factor n=1 Tax=Lapillicoccus sp. TaxID=1909287 RepID=UPI003983491E